MIHLMLCVLGAVAESGSGNVSARIDFSVGVITPTTVKINTTKIAEAPGVSKVDIYVSDFVGSELKTDTHSYLVFDPLDVSKDLPLMAYVDMNKAVSVSVPNSLVFAAVWPSNLKRETVIAAFKQRRILGMIAGLNGTEMGKAGKSKHP